MKITRLFAPLSSVAILLTASTLISAAPKKEEVMTRENGMYVVNTTTLGKDVTGYIGPTPLKVYIKSDKVVKIEVLKNEETPKYMGMVKKELLTKWDGQKVAKAREMQVDAVTGATFSSNALIENVHLALDYYRAHK